MFRLQLKKILIRLEGKTVEKPRRSALTSSKQKMKRFESYGIPEVFKLFLLVTLILCEFPVNATTPKILKTFVNENVVRSLDLSGAFMVERRVIQIAPSKNSPPRPDQQYYIAVEYCIEKPKSLLESVNFNATILDVAVKEKVSGDSLVPLQAELISADGSTSGSGRKADYWRVKPSDNSKPFVLVVDVTYGNAFAPFPEVVEQTEKATYQLGSNLFMPSPYKTVKEKLKVMLPTSNVLHYMKDPQRDSLKVVSSVDKSGKTITYGPYEHGQELVEFDYEPLQIRFEPSSSFEYLTVNDLKKELWVSHWGSNVAVEEWYTLQHNGPQLKTEFSRIDYLRSSYLHSQSTVVKQVSLDLPAGAHGVYYRDDVGNVSTSNFREEKKKSVLELRPRYPLFGGWIYSWFHGFNVDIKDFVRYHPVNGTHILRFNFYEGLRNVAVKNYTMKIVLPEGARDYKLIVPYEDSVKIDQQGLTFTYLDTKGRPTIVLNKKGVYEDHKDYVYVTYKYASSEYFRKPLVASVGFLVLFSVAIFALRTETSLKKKTE